MPPWVLTTAYAFHMAATIVWTGGIFFQAFFLLPSLLHSPQGMSIPLLDKLQRRFSPIAILCLALLMTTGLIQMSANSNYLGLLSIRNRWSAAMLAKHLAFALMTFLSLYQTLSVQPRYSRLLLVQKAQPGSSISASEPSTGLILLLRLNGLLSLLILGLTAVARTA